MLNEQPIFQLWTWATCCAIRTACATLKSSWPSLIALSLLSAPIFIHVNPGMFSSVRLVFVSFCQCRPVSGTLCKFICLLVSVDSNVRSYFLERDFEAG